MVEAKLLDHVDPTDDDPSKLAAKGKAAKVLVADGYPIDLSDPVAAKAKFLEVKTKALKNGYYEGKSLEWMGGGRFRLLVDQLQVEGHSEEISKRIAAENFRIKAARMSAEANAISQGAIQ